MSNPGRQLHDTLAGRWANVLRRWASLHPAYLECGFSGQGAGWALTVPGTDHHMPSVTAAPLAYPLTSQISLPTPADTSHWIIAGLPLIQRRRRWTNGKPTFIKRIVTAGSSPLSVRGGGGATSSFDQNTPLVAYSSLFGWSKKVLHILGHNDAKKYKSITKVSWDRHTSLACTWNPVGYGSVTV